jgi:hypothetical protein
MTTRGVAFATEADEPTVAKLVELTERHCVFLQTLWTPPPINVSYDLFAS